MQRRFARCYVERIAAGLAKVRLSYSGRSVRRYPDGVEVRDAAGEVRGFDAAVIATHPDQALRLLDARHRGGEVSPRGVPLHAQPGGAAHRHSAAADARRVRAPGTTP